MAAQVIVGAQSAIAVAAARIWAGRGDRLLLLGRDPQRLAAAAADLRLRGAESVATLPFEATDHDRHGDLGAEAFTQLGAVDTVLIAHGALPDQAACERDMALAGRFLDINSLSTLSLLGHFANRLEAQGQGCLAVITSVAGERGRQSNYVYGAAKAMVSTFLQGLRNRLFCSGVRVIDIRPGFVDTPMTAEFDKGLLWASPETVARKITRAVDGSADRVYAPFFWRYLMWVIRLIPEPLFKRLRL